MRILSTLAGTIMTALAVCACGAGTQEHAEPPEGVAGVTSDSASAGTVDNANPAATGPDASASDAHGGTPRAGGADTPDTMGTLKLSGADQAGTTEADKAQAAPGAAGTTPAGTSSGAGDKSRAGQPGGSAAPAAR
jgi:hypothetical protein